MLHMRNWWGKEISRISCILSASKRICYYFQTILSWSYGCVFVEYDSCVILLRLVKHVLVLCIWNWECRVSKCCLWFCLFANKFLLLLRVRNYTLLFWTPPFIEWTSPKRFRLYEHHIKPHFTKLESLSWNFFEKVILILSRIVIWLFW